VNNSTPPGPDTALIASALTAIFQTLDASPDTSRTRELRAQARLCEKAVGHWSTTPPSGAQVDAMLHLVTGLRAVATGAVQPLASR